MSLEGAEAVQAVRVKEEPEWESDVARAGLYAEHEAEDEPESEAGAQAGGIKHEVKEEAGEEDACGVSAAAARAGLYTDHTVKEELVLGPVEVHRPKMASVHPGLCRAFSVILERMHVDFKRRTCKIGFHTYKFRLYVNTPKDKNPRKETNSSPPSRNKFNRRTQQRYRQQQQKIKSPINYSPYKCGHCSYYTTRRKHLYLHIRTRHTVNVWEALLV